MTHLQQTIKKAATISGQGLHSGLHTTLTFLPAPEHHGITFKRIDLAGQPSIKADVMNVAETQLGTTLRAGEATVQTIEHVLAALTGLGIDNVCIEMNASEPPICDGSAIDFIRILKEAGIQTQEANKKFIYIKDTIEYKNEAAGVYMKIEPSDSYSIDVQVDYNSEMVKPQAAKMENMDVFEKEFAHCRTFCFLRDVITMYNAGLVRGGNAHNAVVFVDKPVSEAEKIRLGEIFKEDKGIQINNGYLNGTKLHCDNEPARHKLLDIVGDLTLVGMPIIGKITAIRPGHKANTELGKLIKLKYLV